MRRTVVLYNSKEASIFYYKSYPGNPIADELLREGYALPDSLD